MVYTEEQLSEMKNRYKTLLLETGRQGIPELLDWMENQSDFFIAPASANYHGSFPGGLVAHSLNVYDAALDLWEMMKRKAIPEKNLEINIPKDSVTICSLLHDLCKVNFYQQKIKFWKDDTREYDQWRKYLSYEIKDSFPVGHGEKSVIMIQNFVRLTGIEVCAIRFHMGLSDIGLYMSPYTKTSLMDAINNIPLVELIMLSDHFASFVMEKEINQKVENEV